VNSTVAEETLTKLGIHAWNLKTLLDRRAQSTSRPAWKYSVIKLSRLACIAKISEHRNPKSFLNWKPINRERADKHTEIRNFVDIAVYGD